jgi:hypothetical protein
MALFLSALGSHANINSSYGKERERFEEVCEELERNGNGCIRVAFFSTEADGEHTRLVYKFVPAGYRGKRQLWCAFMDNILGMRLW